MKNLLGDLLAKKPTFERNLHCKGEKNQKQERFRDREQLTDGVQRRPHEPRRMGAGLTLEAAAVLQADPPDGQAPVLEKKKCHAAIAITSKTLN